MDFAKALGNAAEVLAPWLVRTALVALGAAGVVYGPDLFGMAASAVCGA